jgi:hypothetical protein
MEKHREAAEALAEHFAEKNDSVGFALLDELLEYQHMALIVLNDGLRASQRK